MNPTTLSVIGIIVAIILGSGAMKFYVSYHTRLVLVEKEAAKIDGHGKDIVKSQTKLELLGQMLSEVNSHLGKLDVIPEMKATIDAMKQRLEERLGEFDDLRREVQALQRAAAASKQLV